MAKLPDPAAQDMSGIQVPGGVAGYRASFGAESAPGDALAQAGQQVARTGEHIYQEAKVEEERVNTMRAEEAFTKLRERQLDLTVGPDNGFTKLKGGEAVTRPLQKEWGQRFDDATREVEDGLANDRQREKFRQRAGVARLQFEQDILKHRDHEYGVYSKEVFDGTVTTELRNVVARWDSPDDVGLSLERVNAAIASRADQLGWPKEYSEGVRLEKQGQIHQAVVQQALATGDYVYAQKWAEAHKGDMNSATAAAVSKAVEDGTQRQVFADYQGEFLASRDNASALDELGKRVSADRSIDDTRKNVLMARIDGRVDALQRRSEVQYERTMRTIERGVGELNSNTLAGFPPDEKQFSFYIAAAKGTELEGLVAQSVNLAKATGAFANKGPVEQERILAQAEAGVRQDPSKFDRKTVSAWRQIYTAQREQVKDNPIGFAVRQGLMDPAPLDLSQPAQAGDALAQRFGVARGIAAKYQVDMKPLTQEEARLVTATLKGGTVEQQREYFGGLARASGGDMEGYSAIMGQISPDAPVMAIAGQYAGRGRSRASDLMLGGLAILQPNRKEDGQPDKGRLWPMPKEEETRKAFSDFERDAFAGRPRFQSDMRQATLAVYAKLSAEAGDASGLLDNDRFKQAANLATGGIERYNGKYLLLPYGYETGQFKNELGRRIDAFEEGGRLAPGVTRDTLAGMPLEPVGDGKYVFKAGDAILLDRERKPLIVDFNTSAPYRFSGQPPPAPAEPNHYQQLQSGL